MSKHSTEDIENISDGNEPVKKPARRSSKKLTGQESTVDGVAAKKRTSKKTSAQAIEVAKGVAVADHDDPELQSLLLQVDTMLTEMTQSKWLSKDWPSLEIDFGSSKK